MASSNEYTLKEAIQALVSQFKIEERISETIVIQDWESIVGKLIARHTSNLYIRKKVLYVEFDNAALRQEMSYAKTKLIQSINKQLQDEVITEIVFL